MSDTGVILSKEVATVRCEVILTNMCSSVLMEHGGQVVTNHKHLCMTPATVVY